MTQEKKYISKSPIKILKNSFQSFFSGYSNKYPVVFDDSSNRATSFGSNLGEPGHQADDSKKDREFKRNRYSVLYTVSGQYHHVGCSSQAEAQTALGILMTDGNRIPVGIYDAETDQFEWEIIGQYFHSQEPITDQRNRLDEVLTIARVLRRRDSSWDAGYLQKPSFFA